MLESFLNFVRPPDEADAKTLKRWRWNVALMLIAGFVFAVWTRTPFGYALAQDVDQKVAAAVEPIQKQIAEVDEKVSKVGQDLTATRKLLLKKLQRDLEREITDAKVRQCKAASVEMADYFRKLVLDRQAEYKDLVGEDFDAPSCAET